jgi:hypothetical protein
MSKERDDFVGIVSGLTNFIQNERTAAYNEAVDMMVNSARDWLIIRDAHPKGKYLPELLDEIADYGRAHPVQQER